MKGTCLCGSVVFEITGELPHLYQCHCTLCRKATGAAANAAALLPSEQFRWLAGRQVIASFQKSTGFTSDFCSNCGSPVPYKMIHRNKNSFLFSYFNTLAKNSMPVISALRLVKYVWSSKPTNPQ